MAHLLLQGFYKISMNNFCVIYLYKELFKEFYFRDELNIIQWGLNICLYRSDSLSQCLPKLSMKPRERNFLTNIWLMKRWRTDLLLSRKLSTGTHWPPTTPGCWRRYSRRPQGGGMGGGSIHCIVNLIEIRCLTRYTN